MAGFKMAENMSTIDIYSCNSGRLLTHLPKCRIYVSVNGASIGSVVAPIGEKPLSKPMLGYYQLDSCKQTTVKF